jgi:hypothetical protein
MRVCKTHGEVKHFFSKCDSRWRCGKCAAEAVTRRVRKMKALLVAENGGRCSRCGYSKCLRALQFHHVDPVGKLFPISGGSKSLDRLREEVKKCILVCANCHGEIEEELAGMAQLAAHILGKDEVPSSILGVSSKGEGCEFESRSAVHSADSV